MIFADKLSAYHKETGELLRDARKLKVHKDVIELAGPLAADAAKLEKAAPYIFWPDYDSWIEWTDDRGHIGLHFFGRESVTMGRGFFVAWYHDEPDPLVVTMNMDMEGYQFTPLLPPHQRANFEAIARHSKAASQIKPLVYAILALINSPKIIRSREVDVTRINKQRLKKGRYPFHPHHEVRLNVDKHEIMTAAGHGDGSHRALHFVRAHLRFRLGQYELVKPHWRGDPAIGMMNTSYRADREHSRWKEPA